MRTDRQIEASRANGARFRGPVTAEGKYNSPRNAMTHGLLAELEEELQPETSIEHTLIEKMAAARWRQFRLWGMEKAAREYQTRQRAGSVGRGEDIPTRASLAFATLGDSRTLDLIMRCDSLCDSQYLRAHRRFMEMRRHRSESLPLSRPEPDVIAQHETSQSEDLTSQSAWDPYVPDSSEQKYEKQPNEPNNSLQIKQSPAANPAPTRQTHDVGGRSDFSLPASLTPPSCKIAGCKIDASCHPLNPQDSR
jgi:hypothetical protein